MHLAVLGELLVRVDGQHVDIRRGKPRSVLLSLVMAAGDTVPSATLIERLWGEAPAANPGNALQTLVAYLRRTLATAGVQPVLTRGAGYALDVAGVHVDAQQFESDVQAARSSAGRGDAAGYEQAHQLLVDAFSLWRGEAYADVAGEDFVMGEVARLQELRLSAAELRSDVLLSLGRNDDAVQLLRRLISEVPLRERLHEQLMVALYRSGRQAEALRAYQDARALLVEELGIDPGSDLRRTEQLVLTHDPALDWAPPRSAVVLPRQGQDREVESHPSPPASRGLPPVVRSPILGRDEEVEQLRECLTRSRIVTVTGPGGAGKSRLALEVAQLSAEEVRWVDLSPVEADAEVAPAVAAALGVTTPPGVAVLERLRDAAPAHPLLVVLDTCEHVVDAVAELVSVVLGSWSSLRVLATSRRPLEIAGELAWPLAPLALPDPGESRTDRVATSAAVQLFAARAQQAARDFRLTDDVAADVAAVCLALDGLPLAIELAAAHADVLSPAAIRARLDERFGLLVRGPRDLLPRQRTLRSTIDWSVHLLTPAERDFFAQLAVFQGAFSLEAVVSVAGTGVTESVDLLTALVRHSLVSRVDRDYYVLLDSLRAYAAELLAADVAPAVKARHALYYARLAEAGDAGLRVPDQDEWVVALRRELPNFRSALVWAFGDGAPELGARLAAALAWFWAQEGMLREAETWLERAVGTETADPLTRSRVLTCTAMYLLPLGRLREAESAASQAYALAAEADDDARAGGALLELGVAQWALGDFDPAIASHAEAQERLARCGDAYGAAMASVLVARTMVDAGHPLGETHLRGALAAVRAVGDAHILCVALHTATRLELDRARLEDAANSAREALGVATQVGYQEGRVAGLHLLGEISRRKRAHAEAKVLLVEAVLLADDIQHLAGTCEGLERLAEVLADEGAPADALRILLCAQHVRRRENLPVRRADRDRVQRLTDQLHDVVGADASALLGASAVLTPRNLVSALAGSWLVDAARPARP